MPGASGTRTVEPRVSVAEADHDATVIESFPEEVYLEFLDGGITTEQFVAALVAHVKGGGTGSSALDRAQLR